MAKQSAQSASTQERAKGRFRVAVKGYPVTGFVEEVNGKVVVHAQAPVVDHFHHKVGVAGRQGILEKIAPFAFGAASSTARNRCPCPPPMSPTVSNPEKS